MSEESRTTFRADGSILHVMPGRGELVEIRIEGVTSLEGLVAEIRSAADGHAARSIENGRRWQREHRP